jgi:hypothetical protein
MGPAAANVVRVFGGQLSVVVDAMEPGGTGDPFSGLGAEQREALAELYLLGYPRGATFLLGSDGQNMMTSIAIAGLKLSDPAYFGDFWSAPGYAGASSERLREAVRVDKLTVTALVRAKELITYGPRERVESAALQSVFFADPERVVGVVFDGVADAQALVGSKLTFGGDLAGGREVFAGCAIGPALLSATGAAPYAGVAPGDEVVVDNRDHIAYCHFHRHSISLDGQDWTRQPLLDGNPIYPQRPHGGRSNIGTEYMGRFSGKMIMLQAQCDQLVAPQGAVRYEHLVHANMGERAVDHFRLWWMEHAAHGPGSTTVSPMGGPEAITRVIDHIGVTEAAVAALIDWVEGDVDAPASAGYRWSRADSRLRLASSAAKRGGVQPVVTARANSQLSTRVAAGESVVFEVYAEVPPGGGSIVGVEWSFEGNGVWLPSEMDVHGTSIRSQTLHAFDQAGTYFPAVRVRAHRRGDRTARFAAPNLGRVRVVVT